MFKTIVRLEVGGEWGSPASPILPLEQCDTAINVSAPFSDADGCNTLIALFRVKPFAWLVLTDGAPLRVLTGKEVTYASVS